MSNTNHENNIVDILTSKESLVEWLVEDFIPQGTITTIGGEAGVGKSVFGFHLCMALASGQPVLSGLFPAHPEGPMPVLYFDQENSTPDNNQYLKYAWEGLERPSLRALKRHFWVAHFQLGGPDWKERAAEEIERVQPRLIYYDTSTPCFGVKDENSNAEATENINALRELARIPDKIASQIVLKHAKIITEKTGKVIKKTLRGAKAWEGAVDAIIFHSTFAGRPRSDDLSQTLLTPAKTRAFGLRRKVGIDPAWVKNRQGLKLKGRFILPKDEKKKKKKDVIDDEGE